MKRDFSSLFFLNQLQFFFVVVKIDLDFTKKKGYTPWIRPYENLHCAPSLHQRAYLYTLQAFMHSMAAINGMGLVHMQCGFFLVPVVLFIHCVESL